MQNALMKRARRTCGFTLIELMTVVTIIAIIAAVALPSYNNYVIKSHRTAVQNFMLSIASREEQYFLDARAYYDTGGANLTNTNGLNLAIPNEVTGYYTLKISPVTGPPPGYTITATPVSGNIQANDGALTLDNTGTKTPLTKWTSQSQ